MGPSGAGKTTLLRILGAELRPSEGRVFVGGRALADVSGTELRALRVGVGFIHQDLRLIPNLRVLHNVLLGNLGRQSLPGSLRGLLAPPRAEVLRAHELLERVGIGEKLYERTDRLSGGEQQRVAVARALFQQPHALLADEPVASVDPARARATLELLTEPARETGLTLCVSLHDLELARALFPRLVGLRDGRVAFDRPTSEVADAELVELYRFDDAAGGS